MILFESESDLLLTIERYNAIVRQCVSEEITFEEFLIKYNSFYFYAAFDGHESDEEEQKLFEKYKDKILPHLEIMEKLSGFGSDRENAKESYRLANRFGNEEGLRRLKEVCERYNI